MKKIQLFLQKPFVKNYLAPVFRGAIQTLPGGGVAVQALRNISHEVNVAKEGEQPPHSYISIVIQVIGLAAIIYAFIAKIITIDELLSLIGFTA